MELTIFTASNSEPGVQVHVHMPINCHIPQGYLESIPHQNQCQRTTRQLPMRQRPERTDWHRPEWQTLESAAAHSYWTYTPECSHAFLSQFDQGLKSDSTTLVHNRGTYCLITPLYASPITWSKIVVFCYYFVIYVMGGWITLHNCYNIAIFDHGCHHEQLLLHYSRFVKWSTCMAIFNPNTAFRK